MNFLSHASQSEVLTFARSPQTMFGKSYKAEEEADRAAAYADNVKFYEEHNQEYKAGKVTNPPEKIH